jgi:hypothetical protein
MSIVTPRQYVERAEAHPQLPEGTEERVSGYGLMGIPFSTGHVLGLRRWTASSVGEPFTSIWHRDPAGRWVFYETNKCTVACSRWFGGGVEESRPTGINLTWESADRLRVQTSGGYLDWSVTLGSSPVTQMMNGMAALMPAAAWKSHRVLGLMGRMATATLGAGRISLAGTSSSGYPFLANPWHLWSVVNSSATIGGEPAGVPAPLAEQTRLGDFWIPQRGIFAMGRVYMLPPTA